MRIYISLISLLSLVGALILTPSVGAIPYPSTTPTGEVGSGTFNGYFTNMFNTTGCSGGQVLRGFSTTGILLCTASASTQYWTSTDAGTNIYFTGAGNVGIGTNTPGAKLEIAGTQDNLLRLNKTSGTTYNYIEWLIGGVRKYWTGIDASGVFNIQSDSPYTAVAINAAGGNVGIGTTTPGAKLEVAGTIKITGGTPGAGKVLTSDASGLASWTTAASSGWGLTGNAGTNSGTNFIGTTDNQALVFQVNGTKAGIIGGTDNNNTYLGLGAGSASSMNLGNIGIGNRALQANTTGTNNTAIGASTLSSNITGMYNTANGASALYNNTANANTAIGFSSMSNNTVGANNTAIGFGSLASNISGGMNIAAGYYSLGANTTGSRNTAIGNWIGYYNQTGVDNTVVGDYAGYGVTGGNYSYNSFFGRYTAFGVTTGSSNAMFGYFADPDLTTGSNNTAHGAYTLLSNKAGSNGVAIGYNSQYFANNTTTPWTNTNTSIGYESLRGSAPASANTGVGNTAIGYQSLLWNTTGNNNTANGYAALYANTTGINNTSLGNSAGSNITTGSSNIAIGSNAQVASNVGSNQLSIGNWIYGSGGNIGIGVANPVSKFQVDGEIVSSNIGAGGQLRAVYGNYGSFIRNDGGNTYFLLTASGSPYGGWNGYRPIVIGNADSMVALNQSLYSLASGNVGIGTTVPGAKLDIVGNIKIADSTQGVGKVLTSDASGLASWVTATSGQVCPGSGMGNTCYGISSYTLGTSGQLNTAIGSYTLNNNTTGNYNTAIGSYTLGSNNGHWNTAIGITSLMSNTSGNWNTAVGSYSLQVNTVGSENTAIGLNALVANTTGYNNTAIGSRAGSNITTGGSNIVIGYNSQVASPTATDQLSIGNWIYGTSGNIGIGTSAPGAKLEVAGQVKITGGTPGAGKVLTSDASGLASWATPGAASSVPWTGITGSPAFAANNVTGRVRMLEVGCEGGWGSSCDANTNGRVDIADSATNVAWAGLTGKPTTIAGYGITDALDLSSFQTVTGVKYFLSNKGATSYLVSNNTYGLEAYSTDGGAAAMSFHRAGAYAINLGLDPDNVFRLGGWSAPSARWQVDQSGNETVAGSMTAGAGVRALGGSVFNSTNGYSFASPGDTDGGMFSPADGILLLATNNVERMRVDSVGNIGIGTATPGAKLDIVGNIKITDGTQGNGKVLTSDASGLASWATPGAASSVPWTGITGSPAFAANNVTGRVRMFEVGCEGGWGSSCDANTNGRVDNADSATNVAWAGVTAKSLGDTARNDSSNDIGTSQYMRWKNYGNGHVIIDASAGSSPAGGGISNTDSQVQWTGSYPTLMGWNGANTYGVRVDSARAANGAMGTTSSQFFMPDSDESAGGPKSIHANSNVIGFLNGYGSWMVYWDTNGGQNNIGNINANGSITGNEIFNNGWFRSNGNAGWYSQPYGGGWWMTDPTWIRSYGGKYMYVDSVIQAGAYMNSPAYYYISDIRLKKDLVKITSSLDKVTAMNGYYFKWKKDDKKDLGLIAQEVEKIFPDAVGEYTDPDSKKTYKNVEYGHLIAPVIEAIKELATIVKSNKADIVVLRSENESLKKRLDAIEARLAK